MKAPPPPPAKLGLDLSATQLVARAPSPIRANGAPPKPNLFLSARLLSRSHSAALLSVRSSSRAKSVQHTLVGHTIDNCCQPQLVRSLAEHMLSGQVARGARALPWAPSGAHCGTRRPGQGGGGATPLSLYRFLFCTANLARWQSALTLHTRGPSVCQVGLVVRSQLNSKKTIPTNNSELPCPLAAGCCQSSGTVGAAV